MNARVVVSKLFTGRGTRPARRLALAAAVALVANGAIAGAATLESSDGNGLAVRRSLSGGDAARVNGAKSPTSRLARTDPSS